MMKKVIGQTVRDLKRGVNKKVLKVPGIEQKVLDATSNEPWGPHGTLLVDIAQATKNYHEYHMIMAVIWKRVNDTGKNWRHVYKALILLEYLVANGSERVIDDIREHAYQISTLSEFQYIDSSGRDQGNNVRQKSQCLVVLVNDKERIIEVREKAAANREKFRSASSGGMYKHSSYDDDRYEGRCGSRDDDQTRYGYGRERDQNNRDNYPYARYRDSYGPEGDRYGREYRDRYGREYEDHYSRGRYRDDDFRGRSRSVESYSPRSQSLDMDGDRASNDGSQSSFRGGRADDQSQDGRRHEQKFSEQNNGAPPSYEEAVSSSKSPTQTERNEETSPANAPETSSPPPRRNPSAPAPRDTSPMASNNQSQDTTGFGPSVSPGKKVEVVDQFDPRNSVSTTLPTTANNAEMDLLGSLSDSFPPNPSMDMHPKPDTTAPDNSSGSALAATHSSQYFEDPFGDSPFKAIVSTDADSSQQQTAATTSEASLQPNMNHLDAAPDADPNQVDATNNFDFATTFPGMTYAEPDAQPPSTQSQFLPQEHLASEEETDVLANILPSTGPSPDVTSQPSFFTPSGQSSQLGARAYDNFNPQAGSIVPYSSNMDAQSSQFGTGNFASQQASVVPSNMASHNPAGLAQQFNSGDMPSQEGAPYMSQNANQTAGGPDPHSHPGTEAPVSTQVAYQAPTGLVPQYNGGNFAPQQGPTFGSNPQYCGNFASAPQEGPTFGPSPQFNGGNFTQQQGPTFGSNPQFNNGNYGSQQGPTFGSTLQFNNGNFAPQQGPTYSYQTTTGPTTQYSSDVQGNMFMQGSNTSLPPASSTGSYSVLPQLSKDKFETKSTVWADTLSRGLVNLNISGPKANPLADIGVDFDAINRKEKRMEKPTTSAVTSTVTMGKAMGSGSGLGRAGAIALRPPNAMMGSSMGINGAPGMGMGAYGGMNQPMGMGTGMGMNPGMNTGMGMGMGMNPGMNTGMGMNMGQGGQMQHPIVYPSGSTMPSAYNPMMGSGGYNQQQYGGGYR